MIIIQSTFNMLWKVQHSAENPLIHRYQKKKTWEERFYTHRFFHEKLEKMVKNAFVVGVATQNLWWVFFFRLGVRIIKIHKITEQGH